jgi:hypothetical protein
MWLQVKQRKPKRTKIKKKNGIALRQGAGKGSAGAQTSGSLDFLKFNCAGA